MSKNNVIKKVVPAAMIFTFIAMNMSVYAYAETAKERSRQNAIFAYNEQESNKQIDVMKKNRDVLIKRIKKCAMFAGGGAVAGAASGCAAGAAGGTVALPGIGTVAGCVGGAIFGAAAGTLGVGTAGCGYIVYDTWDKTSYAKMKEFINVQTKVHYNIDGDEDIDGNPRTITYEPEKPFNIKFPANKDLFVQIDMTPALMGISGHEIYNEEVEGIKLKDILIPVEISIDKSKKITILRTAGVQGIKRQDDLDGSVKFSFYIKNSPELHQSIKLRFLPKMDKNNPNAVLHFSFQKANNQFVDRQSNFDQTIIFY